uniref:Acetyl co-enzyme A carboxylase beta subunit 2 n=1 Tax=Gnetum ula TaxID=3383 RepID=A0A499U834_9SPER|nr:acetyl co-enzyme A carboxylase beta subunit 2 [Gnetum ula]
MASLSVYSLQYSDRTKFHSVQNISSDPERASLQSASSIRMPRREIGSVSVKKWFEENRRLTGLADMIQRQKALEIQKKGLDGGQKLWVQCENCENLLYVKYLRYNMCICEECGYHLQMSSSDRIELLIDAETWKPMDENMHATDILAFSKEEEGYGDHIVSYQSITGLTDAIQTGTGLLNGVPVALAVMDFQFMGGSMGSVVGEKLSRLIEFGTQNCLPVITVCASGGARMQEGTFSLMQMAKVSAALSVHQQDKKLLFVSVLAHPTTGGVTASFGMLGDIIIAEPKAYVAFAGKRVIEQTLRQKIGDESQKAEHLFEHGLVDLIVPRTLLKGVLSEIFDLYQSVPGKKVIS